MKRLLAFALLTSVTVSARPGRCPCRKATADEKTRWGWIVDRTVDEGSVRALSGRVVDANGGALADALVEVFDRPEIWLAEDSYQNSGRQKRLAACVTGEKGEFCFAGLPSAKYELRASGPPGFDPMHVILTLAPKDRQSKKGSLDVTLHVSQ